MPEIRMRTSLTKYQANNPLDDSGLKSMAAAVWHEKGTLMVHPNDLQDDLDRQHTINIGNRLYGKRKS